MKNYFNINLLLTFLLVASAVPLLTSCEEDEGAAPVLDRISLVPKDSTTLSGFRGNTYVIFGKNLETTQAVYFNGSAAPLNTTFVRNDNIIIQIGNNTPYVQAMNMVRVVTAYGEASMSFEVRQRPVITSFSPAVAVAGDVVTIVGNYFDALESVKFIDVETEEEVEAEVVSQTSTQIKVLVPENTRVSRISVTTPSGISVAASTFGFNYIIYADAFNSDWQDWSWSSVVDFNSTSPVKSGTYAWKHTYTGGWGGIQLKHGTLPLAEYTALKFSIYGGPGTGGKEIIVTINWGTQLRITLEEGKWVDYTITMEALGNPETLDVLVLQDVGNVGVVAPYLMFIDDVGFI